MSFFDSIRRGRVDFERKTGLRPTELYLGKESYFRLMSEMRGIATASAQRETTGLGKIDGMNIRVVRGEQNHVGFGV